MKIYYLNKILILIIVAFFLIAVVFFKTSHGGIRYFEIEDDGIKHKLFKYNSGVSYWKLWYINFHDRNLGIDGSADIWNLQNLSSNGNYTLWNSFLIFYNNKTYKLYDEYSPGFFLYKNNSADVGIGRNYIKKLNSDTYVVFFESKNRDVIINLTYEKLVPGVSNIYEIPAWSDYKNLWLLPLPLAKVTGMVNFENTTFEINGSGYYEYNEGVVNLNTLGFIWGQMGIPEKNMSIVLSMYREPTMGRYDMIVLSDQNSSLKSINTFAISVVSSNEYWIVGENEDYQIKLNITKKIYHAIGERNLTLAYYSGKMVKNGSIYEFKDVIGSFDEWYS
jgi:hypothetical protein